jgi:2-polyprenyl-3-methyl-5-hydroxy-6-metoxy-1,4-benzoquinol methylase
MNKTKDIDARDILNIYRHNTLLGRLHVWIRFKTCPFLTIERLIPKAGVIIDYGCGHGIFSHILSMMSADRMVYGIDASISKIEEAKKTLLNENNLKFLNNTDIDSLIKVADCIALLDVICYFSKREQENILRKFYQHLKQGAILIIKDINKEFSLKFIWLSLQEIIAVKILKITQGSCLNFLNTSYLSNLLKDIGFEVNMVKLDKNYLYPHIALICKK